MCVCLRVKDMCMWDLKYCKVLVLLKQEALLMASLFFVFLSLSISHCLAALLLLTVSVWTVSLVIT